MRFTVGTLVKARGREWVVLPDSADDLLVLKPLGGSDDEVTGIYLPLEEVAPARFSLPDPTDVGDCRSCRMLRDAVRLTSRATAGPFRSFGRIAVTPRPYQLVPLLVALKLDPVRILIADDVGIGKTIEASLIARELLDRGDIQRTAVLCPPHLAEQWQAELNAKFHIDAELVLRSTARRLEQRCRTGQSLFDVYPHVVVSMDFIKSDRRRDDFIRACPEFVIVDEAHTCAFGLERQGGRHQRHKLLKQLAASPCRHIVLVTATPHSGKENAFRSLLGLLKPEFDSLPDDLSGDANVQHRRHLAAHFVQRRRGDIQHFLKQDTQFPTRMEAEKSYQLTSEYKQFFNRVLSFAHQTVSIGDGGQKHHRVRWWSVLALLRAVGSSPQAAVATLEKRSATAEAEHVKDIDELGRRCVMDGTLDDQVDEIFDIMPGSDPGEAVSDNRLSRRLNELKREAQKLCGDQDAKLHGAVKQVKNFLKEGYSPILFCRFIPTAEYVAENLREKLPNNVDVMAITGKLPPVEREARIQELAGSSKKVLVCTDCLSEGINLQDHFDAVMHYDLAWNPTRHEQREGRVDRFGQSRPEVRVLTYYGQDNPIDGLVLDTLIRKHKTIRSSLGISVPVPVDTDAVFEAIREGLGLRSTHLKAKEPDDLVDYMPGFLDLFESMIGPKKQDLHLVWQDAADKEKRSRTMFAQETIKVAEVQRELDEVKIALGGIEEIARFTLDAFKYYEALVDPPVYETGKTFKFEIPALPRALRDTLNRQEIMTGRFDLPVKEGVEHLGRTHPVVESLANHIMDSALDVELDGVAKRAGMIRTGAVPIRTTVLLIRFRYDIMITRGKKEETHLAEECRVMAFSGAPEKANWLTEEEAEKLLSANPDENVLPEQAARFVGRIVESIDALKGRIEEEADHRAESLLRAHNRVREASRITGVRYRVKPQLPPDILGIYVYLPVAGGGNGITVGGGE